MVDTQGSIGLRENPETSLFFTSRSRVFSQSFLLNSLYPIHLSRIIISIYIFSRQKSIQVHPSFILPLQNNNGLQKFEHHSNPGSYFSLVDLIFVVLHFNVFFSISVEYYSLQFMTRHIRQCFS